MAAKAGGKTTTPSRPESLDFRSADWALFDELGKTFLEKSWNNRGLAARDCQRDLEAPDRLRTGCAIIPRQFKNPNGTLVWLPEHEERHLLSYQFWRSVAQVMFRGDHLIVVGKQLKQMPYDYRFFAWRPDLGAGQTAGDKTTLAWVTAEYARMKAAGGGYPTLRKADIVRELHELLKKAVLADRSLRLWARRSIENRMREHQLW
jgi:hypothetical protein